MLRRLCLLSVLATICLGGLPSQDAHALPKFKLRGKWKLLKKKRDIRVYQMKIRGSRLIAMRGDAVFDAPIGKVLYLLNNVPRKTKWVDRMIEARYISKKSATDYRAYTRFKFPWPTSHRDFVTETKTFFFPKKKQIVRYQYSVKVASYPPKKGVVRAVIHYSSYTLTSIENDKKTRFSAIGYGDPKGSIPSFIVNFIQRRWPLKNIRTIKKQLTKPHIIEHPIVKEKLFPPPKPRKAPEPVRKAPARKTPTAARKAPAARK